MIKIRPGLVPVLLLTIASYSLADEAVGGVRELLSKEGRLDAEDLIDNDWRLFSLIFPALPDTGYTIEFRASNVVKTDNLAGVKTWSLASDGSLLLLGDSGVVLLRFSFDSCQNALAAVVKPPSAPNRIGYVLRLASQPSLFQACKEATLAAPFCCQSLTQQPEGAPNNANAVGRHLPIDPPLATAVPSSLAEKERLSGWRR